MTIFNYYGKNEIRKCILDIKYFDKKTLNYLSIIFNRPVPKPIKCGIIMQGGFMKDERI
jgi:hypothetical protein